MKLARPVAFGLGVALAIAVGVQGASGAPAALHVKITGKDWARQLGPGTAEQRGLITITRRTRWGGTVKASDARVSGTYRTVFDIWAYPDSRMHFTDETYKLTNARGSWDGTSFGVRDSDGSHFIFGTNLGTGEYEGLLYRIFVHDKASGSAETHTLDLDGWIERATVQPLEPATTGDVHVKVTGTSRPRQILPYWGDLRGGTEKTSDPRTSGVYGGGKMKVHRYADGRMHFSGLYLLRTGSGSWAGMWYGIVTKDRRYIQFVDALGTGEYAGLRYRHVDTGKYPRSAPKTIKLSVNGWIESIATS